VNQRLPARGWHEARQDVAGHQDGADGRETNGHVVYQGLAWRGAVVKWVRPVAILHPRRRSAPFTPRKRAAATDRHCVGDHHRDRFTSGTGSE
jgi:hypothetical protein